eukprot:m.117606 g.117606  ORF g.117606 m.117606 type:complete len:116 (-) comp28590_c0_seq3:531-878(-)
MFVSSGLLCLFHQGCCASSVDTIRKLKIQQSMATMDNPGSNENEGGKQQILQVISGAEAHTVNSHQPQKQAAAAAFLQEMNGAFLYQELLQDSYHVRPLFMVEQNMKLGLNFYHP